MKFRQDVNGTTPAMKRIITNIKTVVRTAHPLHIPRPSQPHQTVDRATHGTYPITNGICAECGVTSDVKAIFVDMDIISWVYVCLHCINKSSNNVLK